MEKANEYAIESLKQIMALASAVLALTITFLKDVLGDGRQQAMLVWLVPLGWAWLFVSIVVAWITIVEAADELGESETTIYVFKTDKTGTKPRPQKLYPMYIVLAWFIPAIPTKQRNQRRKLAASAQNYFLLGLFCLALFAVLNLNTTFHKNPVSSLTITQPQSP